MTSTERRSRSNRGHYGIWHWYEAYEPQSNKNLCPSTTTGVTFSSQKVEGHFAKKSKFNISMHTLESGIEVGPAVINLAFFSRPYGLIRDYIKVI